jgi:2-polyprenyl-3-methyl-5-hydroxy-6-metoxy-1,4-benzoquinol methylase
MLARLKATLDHPKIWAAFRRLLDSTFGLYSKRTILLKKWGVDQGTILDVACGTGQFHNITDKGYLGVDLNGDFIERAHKLHGRPGVQFRQCDVKDLRDEGIEYDTVLMVGILHHVDEQTARNLLQTVRGMTRKQMVMMEVIQEQTNPLGRLIKNNDRGEYVRHWAPLSQMIAECGYVQQEAQFLHLGPIQTIASLWTPINESDDAGRPVAQS